MARSRERSWVVGSEKGGGLLYFPNIPKVKTAVFLATYQNPRGQDPSNPLRNTLVCRHFSIFVLLFIQTLYFFDKPNFNCEPRHQNPKSRRTDPRHPEPPERRQISRFNISGNPKGLLHFPRSVHYGKNNPLGI